MRTRAAKIPTSVPPSNSGVSVARCGEILLSNKNLTKVKNQIQPSTTAATITPMVAADMCGTELESKTAVLQINLSNDQVRNDTQNECLSNLNSMRQATEDKIIGLKPKCTYRERNNNMRNCQILASETHNSFNKTCDYDTKGFGKERLSSKFDNFLRHVDTENNYSERNDNIVRSNVIDDDVDFRHATQFVGTDLVEHSINNSSMDQFFLSSGGDSDCSNREKHLAIRGCDDSRQEGICDNFRISAAEISITNEVDRSGNKSVNGNAHVHSITNKVLTEFVLKNNGSGDILMSSCNSKLADHNERCWAVGRCVPDTNEKRPNLVRKTVTSYEHNSDMDTDYSQRLLTNSVTCKQESDYSPMVQRNMRVVDGGKSVFVHRVLGSADQETIAIPDIPSSKDIRYTFMPKYMVHMESKQTLSQNQNQQDQTSSSSLIVKTNAENGGNALVNVVNYSVDVKQVQKFECITDFDDSLTQEIVQRGQLQPLRSRKLGDNENSVGVGMPICVSNTSMGDCVDYFNEELEDLKVMLVC